MKLIIFGASGSGTTTLARSLVERLNWTHLDADDYYWEQTPVPFQEKLPKATRQARLQQDFLAHENVIISGSLVTWNDYWHTAFDLAIFLQLPPDIRLKRLQQREQERYGDQLQKDPIIQEKSNTFLNWARQYDNPNFDGRSITQHRKWINLLDCPTLELVGDLTNEERIQEVMNALSI